MKRKELLNALNLLKPAVTGKDITESMTYFYFSGESVVAYNDLISIQVPFKTDFTAFVKADDLTKTLSKLKDDEVIFKMEGDILKMKSGKNALISFSTIFDDKVVKRIESVSESFDEGKFKNLKEEFLEAVKLCYSTASKNESDQTLTCLYINGGTVMATDNIRIANFILKQKMDEMLIKASEMKALLPILPTQYMVTKSWVHFKNEEGCIFSIRLIKGEYPDMLQFCDFDGTKVNLPKEILDGVDVASVFVEASDDPVSVTIKNNVCRVFKESDNGKIDFRTPITYKGPDITFGIIPELLKNMMAYSTEIIIADDKAKLSSDQFTLVTSLVA